MSDFWSYEIILSDDDYTEVLTVVLTRDDDDGARQWAKQQYAANFGHDAERYTAELVKKERHFSA